MTEPVALETLKTHLRLDLSATDEDDYLSGMIVAARRVCEKQINAAVIGSDLTLTLDAFPHHEPFLFPRLTAEAWRPDALIIELPGGTVSSIASIVYRDPDGNDQTVDPSTYIQDLSRVPARVGPVTHWPRAGKLPGPVTISYSVSPLPADDLAVVVQAMLLTIGHWYRNREAVAVDVRGAPIELPLAATWLLDSIRRWSTE